MRSGEHGAKEESDRNSRRTAMSTTLGVASSSLFSGRPRLFGDSSKPKITIISISARPNTLTSAEKSHEVGTHFDF